MVNLKPAVMVFCGVFFDPGMTGSLMSSTVH